MSLAKGEKRFPPNQTPLQALQRARGLIENPERWVQGKFGEDGKHCMVGAISRSCATHQNFRDAVAAMSAVCDADDLFLFNDRHNHAEIIAVLDRAIDELMKRAPEVV